MQQQKALSNPPLLFFLFHDNIKHLITLKGMCVSVCTDMFITYLESEPVGMTAAVSIGQSQNVWSHESHQAWALLWNRQHPKDHKHLAYCTNTWRKGRGGWKHMAETCSCFKDLLGNDDVWALFGVRVHLLQWLKLLVSLSEAASIWNPGHSMWIHKFPSVYNSIWHFWFIGSSYGLLCLV